MKKIVLALFVLLCGASKVYAVPCGTPLWGGGDFAYVYNNCSASGQACIYKLNPDAPTSTKAYYFRSCDNCDSGYTRKAFTANSDIGPYTYYKCIGGPHQANACTDAAGSNPCRSQSITIDGKIYCSIGSSCVPLYASSGWWGSPCCSSYTGTTMGSGCDAICFANQCASSKITTNSDRTACNLCAIGYYGTPTASDGTGCTKCSTISSPTGIPTSTATTAVPGSTSATSCYIPAGSSSDTTGSFSWTPACPYVS